jgi:hypothetical protein
MQAVTTQVNVAVRKQKTGGKIITAGQLRDQANIKKVIQQHNGYQIVEQLRCSFPPTGNHHNRRANVVIQFVLDVYACAAYVTFMLLKVAEV